MRHSTTAALAGITLLGLLLHLLPVTRTLYWGADFGEYHAITQQLLRDGIVSLDYRGWGTAYPYFPGMHLAQAAGVFAGVPPMAAEVLLVPALSSVSIVLAFLLAVRLTRDDRVGLAAAAFLAVIMPHVYLTAHAVPAALGDPLFAACLLGILRMRSDRRWLPVLLILTAALVVTHHLTTYFLIVAATLALALRILVSARQGGRSWLREGAYLAALLVGSFTYWIGFATPFRAQILPQVAVPWPLLIAASLLVVPVLYALRRLRPRWRWRYTPRYPSRARAAKLLGVGVAGVFVFLSIVILVTGIPGSSVRPPPETLLLFAPVLGLFAFSAAGRRPMDFHRGGIDVSAWFLAFGLSALAGTVVATTVLVPYRHMHILMWPTAVFAGLGMRALLTRTPMTANRRASALAVIAALLLAAVPATFPPRDVMAGHEEGLPAQALGAPLWLRSRGWGLVGSDHMGSMAAFGFGGRDAVWDYSPDLLRSDTFDDARGDFANASFPAGRDRVRFVLINDDIEAGAMLLPWDPALPLTAEESGKFEDAPFHRVYDDGYSRVYYLNWGLT